jgi:integrase
MSSVLAMEKPNPEAPRQRILADDEIPKFWPACDSSPWSTGPIYAAFLRVVLLTGQRHEETLLTRWSDVDLDGALWLIPAEHRKGVGRKIIRRYPHDVPLSQQAVKILHELKARTGEQERVFHGITQDQRGHRLNPVREAAGLPHWTIHDLRRTTESGIAELGFSDELAHLVTGHRRPGLRGTYNLAERREERRAALAAWGSHVEALVSASAAK